VPTFKAALTSTPFSNAWIALCYTFNNLLYFDALSALSTVAPGQQELVIELHRIPELFTASAGGAAGGSRGPVVSLAQKELELFVAQIKPATSTQAVYKQPARADAAASLHVLQPALPASAKGATMLVPVGHFAQTEVESAAGGSVLELRDTKSAGFFSSGDASVRLQAALEQVLPHAARFQVVWTRQGTNPLTIWSVVPPTTDFVALGMVATATRPSQRPPLELVRCVPKAWTKREYASELVYEGPEGSVWRSRHGLLHASKGRNAPPVHELKQEELKLG